MSNFKARYEEKLKAYDSNIKALPSLTELVPELTKQRLHSFFRRTATLFGNVDKGKVRRPGYLVHGNQHLATYAINNLDQIPNSGDPHSFIKNIVVQQLEFQRKLEFAVGLPGREL